MNGTNQNNAGSNLGVAGLVLGLLSLPLGLMGCTFLLGLLLGILAITLSATGYSQARNAHAPTGILTAALIVSIIGTGLSLVRLGNTASKTHEFFQQLKQSVPQWENEANKPFEEAFREAFKEELKNEPDNRFDPFKQEMEQLERELDEAGEEIENSFRDLSDKEKAERMGRATGRALRKFLDELQDSSITR